MLRPAASGGVNSQRRMAFSAASAKNLLGPGFSNSAEDTLPAASTLARTATRTLPLIVASDVLGTSGKIWSSTSPFAEPAGELDAALLAVSVAGFVSVRREAGDGAAAAGC